MRSVPVLPIAQNRMNDTFPRAWRGRIKMMKILGAWHFDIMMPDQIQPREHSKGGGTDGAAHDSDGNPNVLNANRNDDGRWVNANWDKPDNQWNDDGAFAFLVPASPSA